MIDYNKYFGPANWHPLANLFPVLPSEDLQKLADDIKANGLIDPIVLFEELVLDGRNRLLGMQLAGIEPQAHHFIPFRNVKNPNCAWGDCTPLSWVVSKNLQRRHLTTSQRAAVAVELEPLFTKEAKQRQQAAQNNDKGQAVKANLPEQVAGQARDKAAAAMKVSARSVQDAKKLKKTDPEAFEKVKQGKTTIHAATKKADPKPSPVATAPTTLSETFYVIRRKADRAFYIGNGNFTVHGDILKNRYDDLVDERVRVKQTILPSERWEWVEVQAEYRLTPIKHQSPPATTSGNPEDASVLTEEEMARIVGDSPAPATTKRGRKSKFTPEGISRIKDLALRMTQKAIAKEFGVSPATISNLLAKASPAKEVAA